jgi:hypothetical protein
MTSFESIHTKYFLKNCLAILGYHFKKISQPKIFKLEDARAYTDPEGFPCPRTIAGSNLHTGILGWSLKKFTRINMMKWGRSLKKGVFHFARTSRDHKEWKYEEMEDEVNPVRKEGAFTLPFL